MNSLAALSRRSLLCAQLLWASAAAGSDTLDTWRWRNPLPTGNSPFTIAYLGNQFVTLSIHYTTRELLNSADGSNWVSHTFPYDAILYDVAYGNGRYVVVGGVLKGTSLDPNGPGIIASSPDLTTWTLHESGATNPLTSVTFGAGKFVAIGYRGYIATSESGTNWTRQNSGSSGGATSVLEIEYGNNKFVVSGMGSGVLTSSDGTNWVSNVVSNGAYMQRISYADGRFYAAGWRSVSIVYLPVLGVSTDGVTWTAASDPRFDGTGEFHAVAGNGMLLGVVGSSPSPLSSSADGVTFTNFQPNGWQGTAARPVAFGSGLFVNSLLQTSADGVNWSPAPTSFTNTAFVLDLYYLTNQYVAMGAPYLTSSNGLRFSPTTNTLPSSITRIRQANGLFLGVGSAGSIYRSTNGWNWESRNSATTVALKDAAHGNGLWVAVGGGGTITVSPTANAWSLRPSGTTLPLNGVTYGGGLFVAVGESGTVLTSSDGAGWTAQYVGTLETLNKITHGNGQFVAVGANGAIATSANAVDWTVNSNATSNRLSDITFGEGVFCAVGDGTVLTSSDAVNWTFRRVPTTETLRGVRLLNGTFFVFDGLNATFNFYGQNIIQSGPVTPVQLQASWSAGTPRIALHATPNLVLRLEASDELLPAQWNDLGLIQVPAGGTIVFDDTSAAGHATRFYRAAAP